MSSTETIGGLSFDVNYQLIFGVFVGDGELAECSALAEGTFDFSNDQASKILTVGVRSATGLPGPVDLADCVYSTNDPGLAPEDFRIQNVPDLGVRGSCRRSGLAHLLSLATHFGRLVAFFISAATNAT